MGFEYDDAALAAELAHEAKHYEWVSGNPDDAADYYLDLCDEQWLRSMIDNHLLSEQAACDKIDEALMAAGKGNKEAAWDALTEALQFGAKAWAKKQ